MSAFEQVTDTPTAAYPVVAQNLPSEGWYIIPANPPDATEGEAELRAAQAVAAGAYRARVCRPTGDLFQDVE